MHCTSIRTYMVDSNNLKMSLECITTVTVVDKLSGHNSFQLLFHCLFFKRNSFDEPYFRWDLNPQLYACLRVQNSVHSVNTIHSLMFAGTNVCDFETKPCLRGLIFAITGSSGLAYYLGTWIMYLFLQFLQFKGGHDFRQINPSQTLMNLQ